MPIDYKEYPADWHEISLRIRYERARGRCEKCGLTHNALILRLGHGRCRALTDTERDWIHERMRSGDTEIKAVKFLGFTRVVLTVAHLNHIKDDVSEENLKALCQSCHLKLDLSRHMYNRRYGKKARENNLSLIYD